jgi:hypothetical protein
MSRGQNAVLLWFVVAMMVPGEREERNILPGSEDGFVGAGHARRAVFSLLECKQIEV